MRFTAQPTPKLVESVAKIWNNPHTILAGGWGGSKTTSIVAAAYRSAFFWEPGRPGLAAAPTFNQLYTGFVDRWQRFVEPGSYRLFLSGIIPRIECYTPKGVSIIYLASGQYPRRVEGKEVAWAAGDELQDMGELWALIVGRVRDPGANHLRLFGAGLTIQGWMERVLVDGELGPVEWVRIRGRDNPTLPEGYFSMLDRRLSKRQKLIYIDGEFAPPERAIYPTYLSSKHADDELDFRPGAGPVWLGQDFNLCPMAGALVQVVAPCSRHDTPRCFHVIGEIVEDGTTQEAAQRAVLWYQDKGLDHRAAPFAPDATGIAGQHARGESDVGIFMQFGFRPRGPAMNALLKRLGHRVAGPCVNPLVRDRDNAMNAALEDGQGMARLYFSKRLAPKTTAAVAGLETKGRKTSPHDHPTAALGYIISQVEPIVSPSRGGYKVSVGDPSTSRRRAKLA